MPSTKKPQTHLEEIPQQASSKTQEMGELELESKKIALGEAHHNLQMGALDVPLKRIELVKSVMAILDNIDKKWREDKDIVNGIKYMVVSSMKMM